MSKILEKAIGSDQTMDITLNETDKTTYNEGTNISFGIH